MKFVEPYIYLYVIVYIKCLLQHIFSIYSEKWSVVDVIGLVDQEINTKKD